MATFKYRSEALVMCPFNPAHQVKCGRLQIHITKCRKHLVPASELMHHMNTCPMKSTVVRYITESPACRGDLSVPPYNSPELQPEENWDAETDVVVPLEHKIVRPSVKPVFQNVQKMTPAERRHFYASLHSNEDGMPIPRQPKSQPKVLQQMLTTQKADDDDEDDDLGLRMKLLGLGRGRRIGDTTSINF
ncbi:gametocyte-specific factor 1 homolog [Ornithodoros turicata]|uniref:gametocyte-specific factor 1 homolog n=1 Tax=Ornithodoros turicata TaxID=34597 RepID=UPI003139526A